MFLYKSTTGVIRWPCGNFRCTKQVDLCCCARPASCGVKYAVSLSDGVARERKVYPPALLLVLYELVGGAVRTDNSINSIVVLYYSIIVSQLL